jgi:hypothetical protein
MGRIRDSLFIDAPVADEHDLKQPAAVNGNDDSGKLVSMGLVSSNRVREIVTGYGAIAVAVFDLSGWSDGTMKRDYGEHQDELTVND